MKIEKSKIVFTGVIICILLFIGLYGITTLSEEEAPELDTNKIPLPKLENDNKQYRSKLEALEDIKKERHKSVPSIYDERLLDSSGVYDPDLLEKEKMHIIDSIYEHGRIDYADRSFMEEAIDVNSEKEHLDTATIRTIMDKTPTDPKLLALEHQLFFASNPLENETHAQDQTDQMIYVRVDGTQTVRANYRLQMRLDKGAKIDNAWLPRNTLIYGFISFKPNRAMITIDNINHTPIALKAFDLLDGNQGVYIENSFRGEAGKEVVGNMVDDINIAGVPQVSGIKKIFQKNNRSVKVTIMDNYRLILKTN